MASWQDTLIQSFIVISSVAFLGLLLFALSRMARGSLGRQLLLAFVGVAAVSLLPLLFLFTWQIRYRLTEQTGETFAVMAQLNSRRLGEELAREIGLLQNISRAEELYARIAATSETELAPLSELERSILLENRDRAWQAQTASELQNATRNNPAGRELQNFTTDFTEFQQLFLTDRYGGLVATTGVSARYFYGGEEWWQNAWNGRDLEAIHLDTVSISGEQMATAVRIAFAIHPPSTTVARGVLHAQLPLSHLETVNGAMVPEAGGELLLMSGNGGDILYRSHSSQRDTQLPPGVWQHILDETQVWSMYQNNAGETFIYSVAPLFIPTDQAALAQLNWYVIVQQKQADALATVNQLMFLAFIGAILALAIAFLVGGYMTNRLTQPIVDLTAVATAMADGDLERSATPSGPTEFQALASAFNHMTHQLRQSLGKLEQEVDERRQVEEKLQAYTAELERSNRELQDFAYAASHDLQEPLRKIQTFGNRLEEKYGNVLDERGLDYLARMQDAAVRMQTLIIDLLHYSRVTTRAQPFAPVQLNEIVQGVISDLETRIEEVSGEVRVGDLPEIEADRTQMRQLFQNLIGNALKFHQEDKPPVVEVSGEINSDGKCCHIWVRDNGIGFDPAYDERIFALFQRLHGRHQYEGSGIGLAVCRKIVDRHGGTIKAESQPGEGATFTITLPLKQ
jgi:signal transduction histidine kinase